MKSYQIVIIGSGPGGYVAAIRAGMLGLKTAIVEKDSFLGGTCLHRGCIPTKALLHTAEIYDEIRKSAEYGISVDNVTLDIHKIHERKAGVVDRLSKGVQFLVKKRNVDSYTGTGSFIDAKTIRIVGESGEETISAENVIIATGSTPADLPHIAADGERVVSSDHILRLEAIPESLAVIGSGAVGSEFASIFTSFGSTVHLIELLPRLLPIEDDECSTQLERSFKSRGMKCYAGTEVLSVKVGKSGVALEMKKGENRSTLEVETVLLATGRRPVLDGLACSAAGVETDRGFIKVDGYMQTNVAGVYAIGDVVSTPALAHVASKEGILAVHHIAGKPSHPIDYNKVPNCTYSHPEVASVGLTERAAREQGHDVRVGKFSFSAISKAVITGDTTGFVKIVGDKRYDEVLGVHIIGPRATELIAEASLGMQLETTVEEVAETIHAHPTLSEAMLETAHSVYGEAIHI